MGLAVSTLENFGLMRGLYSNVFRSSTCISLSDFLSSGLPCVTGNFIFLKNPCPVLSPSQLLATIFSSHPGIKNLSLASSSGLLSYTPLATFTNVSIPTTSAVLKVADRGRPMIGPVKASISSILNSSLSANRKIDMIPNMPIRFAINAGVSLQRTVVLPR